MKPGAGLGLTAAVAATLGRPGAGATTVALGTRQYSLHIQSWCPASKSRARTACARRYLLNIQAGPDRAGTSNPDGFHALPIDKVLAQPIVHRVQIVDADITGELRRGFLRAVLHFQIAAQAAAQQGHRSIFAIYGCMPQVDAARFHAQIERQRLRRNVAA